MKLRSKFSCFWRALLSPRRRVAASPRRFPLSCLALLAFWAGAVLAQSPVTETARAMDRAEYARAESLAAGYLRKHPGDVPMRLLLARAVLAEGKFREAFWELRRVLGRDPQNMDALYYLGLIAGALSQVEYERLYALAPESDRVHQLLGDAAFAQENPAEAESEFLAGLKIKPNSVDLLTSLAELKRSQSKFDEAIVHYSRAAEIGPINYDIAYGLGTCYTYKQEHDRAATYFRRATALAPEAAVARFALGNALLQHGETEIAIPELKKAVELQPRLKEAWFVLGRAYQKVGRQAEAKEAYRKIEQLTTEELNREQGAVSAENQKAKGKYQKAKGRN